MYVCVCVFVCVCACVCVCVYIYQILLYRGRDLGQFLQKFSKVSVLERYLNKLSKDLYVLGKVEQKQN